MSSYIFHFLNVAQHGSYKKAAAETGYTTEGVYQGIRSLEGETGCMLVYRAGRGLTPEGETFLPYAKRSMAAFNKKDYKRAVAIQEKGKQAIQALAAGEAVPVPEPEK